MGRLIVDGDGRALHQPDDRQPDHLTIHTALPDETKMTAPSIGVTARSTRHDARETTQRAYPLHSEATQQATDLTNRQQAEESARHTVAEAWPTLSPEPASRRQHRRTRIIWQHDTWPPREHGPIQVDSVTVLVGASGDGVQAEASGRPSTVIAMLAAFARAARE